MSLFDQTTSLTIRTRLRLVAALCVLLACVPTVWLGRYLWHDVAQAQAALSALAANHAWQAVLKNVQAHREAGAAIAGQPEQQQTRTQLANQMQEHLQQVAQALPDSPLQTQHQQGVQAVQQAFGALSQTAASGAPALPQWLTGHLALQQHIYNQMLALNTEARLLLDTDPGIHFLVRAGLQDAVRVGDALSELSALAAAAAVDDTGAMAAAAARYREHVYAMRQHLQQAGQGDATLAEHTQTARQQLQQQELMVQQLLTAVAQDVSFPLESMRETLHTASKLQTDLSQSVLDLLDTRLHARVASLRLSVAVVLLGLLAGLALVLGVLWRTVYTIMHSVNQTMDVTERIAQGDLSVPVPMGRQDEMGRVLNAIGRMRQQLQTMVRDIQNASQHLQLASSEIAHGNLNLSQRTEHTASNLQETASVMEEIGSAAHQGAQSARQASTLAREATQAAHQGREVVSSVVGTMQGIHASSRQIGEITGLIDGIAFQTNILALNAAVEAARAGEQGRGFAVVAGEVRSLAQRASSAARDIRQLIESSVKQIESGSALVAQAGEAMQHIGDRIEAASQVIADVEQAVASQAGAIAQVQTAVARLDQLTQQNAALVEESATAASVMQDQAQDMRRLVGNFQLDTDGHPQGTPLLALPMPVAA
ncbi:MAG: methyl-accepting chemotaxis protein [Macromonas sp.]